MNIHILADPDELGQEAAVAAAEHINAAIQKNGEASIILATGASQFATLQYLVNNGGIDWSKVTMFHLDEYIGLDANHPASFRKYLQERFLNLVPALKAVHLIDGTYPDPQAECRRLGDLIQQHTIDVALIGIGENGHLAFNDPPADFATEEPFLVLELDHDCRMQQVGEGWFSGLEEVPAQAITMSIREILRSRHLIVSVPDTRKAMAVQGAVEGPLTNTCPASILREHPNCELFLDIASASLLTMEL